MERIIPGINLQYYFLILFAQFLFIFLLVCCGKNSAFEQDHVSILDALARKRSLAVVRSDTATLDSILAPDFRYINIYGETMSREKYLRNNASLGNDSSYWVSLDIDSMHVKLLDNTAIVTFRAKDKFVYEGNPYENYCKSTFVYEWQTMHGSVCLARQPKSSNAATKLKPLD